MTKPAVTPYPGVYSRPDSKNYMFGVRVPTDLRSKFPGPWAARHSLETADLREANEKAKMLHAEWCAQFAAMRSDKPAPFDAAGLRGRLLARVEWLIARFDAQVLTMSPALRDERAREIRWTLDASRESVKDGSIPEDFGDNYLDVILKGETRSEQADREAMPFMVLWLELKLEAVTDTSRTFPLRVQRLKQRRELVELEASQPAHRVAASSSPAERPAARAEPTRRINDALAAWSKRVHPEKTKLTFERHARQFAEMMGDPPLSKIDRTLGVRFRDALQAWALTERKTARTADNVLTTIRALLNVARDQEWLNGNPFERLAVTEGGKKSEGREPWTDDELVRLFDAPLFTSYELPEGGAMAKKAGRDAAYWVPLLAAYTGARAGELCQLWTDDVGEESGGLVLEFRENSQRGQSLKTTESRRAVPVHSELIRLGFRDYWLSIRRDAPRSLFPALPTEGQNGAAGQFGQWFGQFKRAQGFQTPTKTLHSFRHTVETELGFAGATPTLVDAIIGHAGQGIGRQVYAATIRRKAERLRPTIELLKYPGLALEPVFGTGHQP